ncbi:recombination protein RecR [Clostridia bacterium]|nr:recombination protein RecR [Clostridia bacterium]
MADYYVPALAKLIEQFESLPSIGHKTATRLAFHMLSLPESRARAFSEAIMNAKNAVRCCDICQNLTDTDVCGICTSVKRDKSMLCVVESPKDVISMEKTAEFNGLYHVLHGAISPMDGISPEDIRIKELIPRITDEIKEVIIATNPTIEGEATAMYLAKLIRSINPIATQLIVTRIAHGVPVGADLEFADQITLGKAISGRREMD